MVDNYFKVKKQLEELQEELDGKLRKILEKNGYDEIFAWFKFNDDELVIVWSDTRLPRQIIDDFEDEFGKIDYIYISNNPLSQKVFIKFGGE